MIDQYSILFLLAGVTFSLVVHVLFGSYNEKLVQPITSKKPKEVEQENFQSLSGDSSANPSPRPDRYSRGRKRAVSVRAADRDSCSHLGQKIYEGTELLFRTEERKEFEFWQECPKCEDTQVHWIEKIGKRRKDGSQPIVRKCRSCGQKWEQS